MPGDRVQRFVHGAVSSTENANVKTWFSYDEQGRIEWLIQNISGLGVKTVDYRYGPTGATQEVAYQKGQNDQFTHYYEYDFDGRLFKAYTSTSELIYDKRGQLTNAGLLKLQATYFYYLHGPVKRVVLANGLQGIDYVYNLDGSVKSINSGNVDADPGEDDIAANNVRKDVFGMSLEYFTGDYVAANGTTDNANGITSEVYPERHDGLIQAMRWHSPIEPNAQFAYRYSYDNDYQFRDAGWGVITANQFSNAGVIGYTSGGLITGTNQPDSYRETINGYDRNGNILHLNRHNSAGDAMSRYVYKYQLNTNKLDKIVDADDESVVLRDYEYDEIGQLTGETGEAEKYVEYDVSGKVICVFSDAARTKKAAEFTYDDRGFRVTKTAFDLEGEEKWRTWYVRDANGSVLATYEKDLSTSGNIKQTEVPVYASGRIGMYKPEFDFFQYELTDHLGNVRAVIGEPLEIEYLATMETERLQKESREQGGDFYRIKNDPIGTFNHTVDPVSISGVAEPIADPNEVLRLNNLPTNMETATGSLGTGIMLAVNPGDKISAEVFVKYTDFNIVNQDFIPLAANLLKQLFNVTTGTDVPSLFNVVDDPSFTAWPAWSDLDENQPRAFLNVLLFDSDNNLQLFDFAQVSSAAKINGSSPHEQLMLEVTIEKPGFIYVFLSNHSNQNTEVYFDDLKIKHTFSDIIAGGDFYPFGLAISDRQVQRDFYRYGYQGQFSEKDFETQWNQFELRAYDATTGKWASPDPSRQYWSSFKAMGNDPANQVDPDGAYTRFGAWWRSGFSFDLIYDYETEEWGYNTVSTGDLVLGLADLPKVEVTPHFGDERTGNVILNMLQAEEESRYGVIREYKPNFLDRWAASDNVVWSFAYSQSDNVYMTAQFFAPGFERRHIDGQPATSRERADALAGVVASALPYTKFRLPKMNASQFSSLFKGTFVARLSGKRRSDVMKIVNKIMRNPLGQSKGAAEQIKPRSEN